MMQAFEQFVSQYRKHIDQQLKHYFSQRAPQHQGLQDAMTYSLLNGGKRVRPLLCYASALAIAEPNPLTDRAAMALECIHAYSLIHDDLPAMDDDDIRRGKPTCHIAFDEATAILAGDALQTLAFELLTEVEAEATEKELLTMIKILAKASGCHGMIAGQAIDLSVVESEPSLEELSQMHRLKTGALIAASIALGALSTGMVTDKQLDLLSTYANAIGLAFQIQDDILDVTMDTETLGKQQGSDIANNKPTFVSLLGLDEAKKKSESLYQEALTALGGFDYRSDYLRHLAAYIIKRQH
jgi:farnesyl diphosphate synthase/geranylgeranyl diphosphate synthase type II